MYTRKNKTRLRLFFSCDLPTFLFEHLLQVISVIAAVVGILAAVKSITWLVIVGAIVSVLSRIADLVMDVFLNDGYDADSSFDDDIPIFLKVTTPAVILAVVGMVVLRVLWQMPWFYGFCLCLNGSILLSWIVTLIVLFRMKRYSV